MATERKEGPEGPVVRVGVTMPHCGKELGIIVRYPDGERWEPFQHLRRVGGKLESWW